MLGISKREALRLHPSVAPVRRLRHDTPASGRAAGAAASRWPVVSTKPLSAHAKAQARGALRSFAGCMKSRGYDFFESPPVVKNLSRGRAFFGFERADPRAAKVQKSPRLLRERTACEQKLNAKLDAINATDRDEPQY